MKLPRLFVSLLIGSIMSVPVASMAANHDMPDTYFYLGGHASSYYYGFHEHEGSSVQTVLPGAQLGWRFSPNWSVQAWWEKDDVKGVDLTNRLVSGRYHFNDTSWFGFEPYAGLAAGEIMLEDSGMSKDRQTKVGPAVGVQTLLFPHVAFDLGARSMWVTDSERWDGEFYAGINFLFGSSSSNDQPVGKPLPGDQDGDGVNDDIDQCARTVANTKVDAKGCEIDSDDDGVLYSLDRCLGTPAGALVDDQGCEKHLTKDIRQTLNVHFELSKAVVSKSSYPSIAKVATLAKQYPSAQLTLSGYTDSSGSAALNKRLSKERAQAVKNVLVDHFDIDADRVSAHGYGEADPVADNTTAAGRAENRRVEVVLEAENVEK